MDMLRNPGFQASRFAILLDELYEAMRQRNDYPEAILSREWDLLLYGQDHFEARLTTATMLQSFTGRDLQEMHRAIFHPGNLVIAVNGDFEPEAMLQRLERACAGWAKGKPAPDPPAPAFETKPGVFHVQRDIPQGTVRLGLRCIPRDHPDAIPLALMNDILGGGGFTSRITKRVRDDEGLAYSAGSALLPRVHYPGEWRASVQSKNRTVALSIRLILEEIDRLRTDPVLDAELRTAANALIETFPRTFESKRGMLAVFVSDELTGRPADYWARFRQRVGAVTTADIQRVARSWLDPDGVVILAVGDWAAIAPGDLEGRASMGDVFGGRVTHLPLRDPLTLEPIPGTTPDD